MSSVGVRAVHATAAEINREHNLAVGFAAKAVEHARRAGELLLQVKASLPHGAFLPWVEANPHYCKVVAG